MKPPIRILIVEDTRHVAEFLRALLRGEGAVETAADGAEGLRKTGEKYFNLIISDINMPVMDGIEFYRRAVAEDPSLRGRFLFFASMTPEHMEFLTRNGLHHLKKPAGISTIQKSVRHILGTAPPAQPSLSQDEPGSPSAN